MQTVFAWILSGRRLSADVAIDPFDEFRYNGIHRDIEPEWIFLIVFIILFLALLAGVIVLAILLSKSKAELHRLKAGSGSCAPGAPGFPVRPGQPGYFGCAAQPGQPITPTPQGYSGAPVQPGYPGYGTQAGYLTFGAQTPLAC